MQNDPFTRVILHDLFSNYIFAQFFNTNLFYKSHSV